MRRYTILLVDDERENLNLLENVLGDRYAYLKAPNGIVALDMLKKQSVDMILSDQRMPKMKGVELLERARKVRPEAMRLLVTAYPDITVAVDAINRGEVNRYISKPFDPDELRTIVRQQFEVYALAAANRQLNAELTEMAAELLKVNQRLTELDRMKDAFLANVSHELRTPLVSSLGYLELILAGEMGAIPSSVDKGLRVANRNLLRLQALIEDLLNLVRHKRQRAVRPEDGNFALPPLIDECVQSLKARARKESLDVKVSIPPKLPRIRGDERGIHSVLTNVLSNAEKFTGAHAKISIRVAVRSHGRCVVEVVDNGIGPHGSDVRTHFPSFKSSDDDRARRYQGLGIGLTLAQQILERHESVLALQPDRGGGARVTFDLPLVTRG